MLNSSAWRPILPVDPMATGPPDLTFAATLINLEIVSLMLDNFTVRTKLLVSGSVPAVTLVAIAIIAFASGTPAIGAIAGIAAAATVVIAYRLGDRLGSRLDALVETIENLDVEDDQASDGEPAEEDASDDDDAGPPSLAGDEIGALTTAANDLISRAATSRATHHAATAENTRALLESTATEGLRIVGCQLDEIDWLEAEEDDAARLDRLFRLDHLNARLHRELARLLVVAGQDSIHDRSQPAPVVDIIRVAMGENADYRNIQVRSLDEVMIIPTAACEMAQLLSELLANSTENSKDGSPTEVHATHLEDGSYRVTIIDRGRPVDAAELHAARETVRSPSAIADLPDTRIGLNVAGRLARHLGAAVDFSPTAGSGLTVDVRVPAELVTEMPGGVPERYEARIDRTVEHADPSADPASESADALPADWTPPAPPPRASEFEAALTAPAEEGSPARTEPAATPEPRAEPTLAERLAATQAVDTAPQVDDSDRATPSNEGATTENGSAPPLDEWTPPALPERGNAEIESALEDHAPSAESAETAETGQRTAEPAGPDSSAPPAVLTRRKRTAKRTSTKEAPPIRVSTRSPKETRSLLTNYRKGLEDGRQEATADD